MLRMQEMAFPCFKFQTFSGEYTPTHVTSCYPLLISNDKLWLIFFYFLCVYHLFISNTSIVRINFGANLDAQNAGNDISMIQISKIVLGEYTPRPPPIHAWYIGHTRGLQPLLSPSNILSHRKVPFQKMPPPHGKILKKGPADILTTSKAKGSIYLLFTHKAL
jgi:hypothetical protein